MFWNQIKTVVLLASLSGLLLFVGNLFGGMTGLQFALVMALVMNGIAYFFSEKMVLRMYRAQPLDRAQYAWVYDMVEELSATMKMPMPKMWLIPMPMANAFATGRDPHHASVGVTQGILDLLEKNELRGVLAHELSHVKNRDILVSTIAATLATAIGYLANMARYAAMFGGARTSNNRRSNPLALMLVAMLMPIAALFIRLAISRSREYLADESGAKHSQDPLALASALEKLHTNIPHAHMRNDDLQRASTTSLFIVFPFTGTGLRSLFSTHPPMHRRIERLRAMYERMF